LAYLNKVRWKWSRDCQTKTFARPVAPISLRYYQRLKEGTLRPKRKKRTQKEIDEECKKRRPLGIDETSGVVVVLGIPYKLSPRIGAARTKGGTIPKKGSIWKVASKRRYCRPNECKRTPEDAGHVHAQLVL
jgi:hypothetical protein